MTYGPVISPACWLGQYSMRFKRLMVFAAAAALFLPAVAIAADDDGRYGIVNIKRDVDDGKGLRTVNGTMMIDTSTGRTWILDEQRGRWIPVGFREAQPSSDVTITPDK